MYGSLLPQIIDWMMIVAAYGYDHWESERNHSWEFDGWDSNCFGLETN